ncbi:acid protease [Penicillium chermesinum]|nr:acid protease [Penicillium chermesinum]
MKFDSIKCAIVVAALEGAVSAAPSPKGRFSVKTFKGPKLGLVSRVTGSGPSAASTNFMNMTFGDQTFPMEIDTGSSALWLFNTGTPSNEQGGHPLYNPNASSTFQLQDGYSFDIEYADGTGMTGPVGTEDVTMAGITIQGQYIGWLSGHGAKPIYYDAHIPENTWHQNAEPLLDQPVWTVDFYSTQDGSMDFGYIDDSKYQGDIAYAPCDFSNGAWSFNITGWNVPNDSVQTGSGSVQSIADTGTPSSSLPQGVLDYYYGKVDGSSRDSSDDTAYVVPCDADLPDLILTIEGGTVTIPGSQMNAGTVDGGCRGAFYITTGGGNLGSAMFNSNFVVYSQTNAQIGFALKA